jgi:hypothetical protein
MTWYLFNSHRAALAANRKYEPGACPDPVIARSALDPAA